jgi:hypothetical protein
MDSASADPVTLYAEPRHTVVQMQVTPTNSAACDLNYGITRINDFWAGCLHYNTPYISRRLELFERLEMK